MLSRDEERRLAEIERRLAEGDPGFTAELRAASVGARRARRSRAVLVACCALGAALFALGVAGGSTELVFWGLVSFGCAVAARRVARRSTAGEGDA
ncbi:DUF3040 domain-containing protein [Actinokineospora bangkokensis]|uniref:DUF3040 domain-containing protein n=1 Tax=Actinokineospora bangkokensis TaxID=1193682 RepID=A0A1Q9LN60_9PSEU|nr:DUF3040 domain-containing protein [Actinokineospora bangkokensis]OLR93487.1 hypothetical protein BJP25_14365 [Actinokineospora bangkokensis]